MVIGRDEITDPVAALRLLVDILAQMAEGNAVTIMPIHPELTTQRAADFLNVSRPHLVGRLERNDIAFRKLSSHLRCGNWCERRDRAVSAPPEVARQHFQLGLRSSPPDQ